MSVARWPISIRVSRRTGFFRSAGTGAGGRTRADLFRISKRGASESFERSFRVSNPLNTWNLNYKVSARGKGEGGTKMRSGYGESRICKIGIEQMVQM